MVTVAHCTVFSLTSKISGDTFSGMLLLLLLLLLLEEFYYNVTKRTLLYTMIRIMWQELVLSFITLFAWVSDDQVASTV